MDGGFSGVAPAGKVVRVCAADEEALRGRRDDTVGSANMLKSRTTSLNLLMPAHYFFLLLRTPRDASWSTWLRLFFPKLRLETSFLLHKEQWGPTASM